jgi:hypothetical protein
MTIADLSPENHNKACIALSLVQRTVIGARGGYSPIYAAEHKALTAASSELKVIFLGNAQISNTLEIIDRSLKGGLLAKQQNNSGIEKALSNTEDIMQRLGMGPPDWKIPAMPAQQA